MSDTAVSKLSAALDEYASADNAEDDWSALMRVVAAARRVVDAAGQLCPAGEIDAAKRLLASTGHVVLREKSYRQAQERQRVAECYRDSEIRAAESARAWARDCLAEERRLRERCTFLYGLARAKGATVEECAGGA